MNSIPSNWDVSGFGFKKKKKYAWKKGSYVFKSPQKFLQEKCWRLFCSVKMYCLYSLSLVFHDECSNVNLMPIFLLSFSPFTGLYTQQSYEIQHY